MDVQNASKDFIESNNLITKFVFIIGLLIVFLILLRFFISIGAWLFMASPKPHFTDGLNSTDEGYMINVDPTKSGSKPVLRSVNEKEGLEFTYSIWLYIKGLDDPQNKNCIFRKGARAVKDGDETNAPGLYIQSANNEAHLSVKMDYYASESTTEGGAYGTEKIVDVKVPFRTWANVMIRCNGHNLDVLINGILYSSKLLSGIPRQNYYDIEFSGGAAGGMVMIRFAIKPS